MASISEQAAQSGRLAAAGLRALEWAPSVALVLVLGAGVVLWLAGHKYLRGAFLLLGAAGCGWLGLAIVQALPELKADPLASIGIGAVLGALVGWLAYRICIATATGLILGVIAGLVTIVALEQPWDQAPTASSEAHAVHASDASPSPAPLSAPEPGADDASGPDPSFDARARDILNSWVERARECWNALPRDTRMLSTLATLTGTLVGLCLGLALHRRAAAITTSIIGPALAAPAALALASRSPVPVSSSLPERPTVWLIAWGAAAVLGMMLQMWSMGRKNQNE